MADEPRPSPDFSTVARRPSERLAIVQHVLATPGLEETEYLEWKSHYDLSTRIGAAKAAKHLIGFANRDIARAARAVDGHAYLLLGAEPGRLGGVPQWDSADIENWISPFVGHGLIYDVHYVGLDGSNVLMLVVAPPKAGDPIFALQRSTGDESIHLQEGTIYVRHGGKTGPASAADIAMLTARAKAGISSLALSIEVDSSELIPLPADRLTDEFRDQQLERRRQLLLAALPERTTHGWTPVGERRSPEQYREEVEIYIHSMEREWPKYVTFRHIEANDPGATFFVVNVTDENFEDVVVEITIPLPRPLVHLSVGGAEAELELPEEPVLWGEQLLADLDPVDLDLPHLVAEPSIHAVDVERTTVRFLPTHIYPHTRHEVGSLTLGLMPHHAGTELKIEWRATARNTRGQLRGTVSASVLEGVNGEADV